MIGLCNRIITLYALCRQFSAGSYALRWHHVTTACFLAWAKISSPKHRNNTPLSWSQFQQDCRNLGTWRGTLFAFSLRIAMPFWLVHVYGHWWLADVLFFFQNVPKDITPICVDLNKNAKKIIICSKNIYRPCIYMLIRNVNVQSMRLDTYYSFCLWISRFLELF